MHEHEQTYENIKILDKIYGINMLNPIPDLFPKAMGKCFPAFLKTEDGYSDEELYAVMIDHSIPYNFKTFDWLTKTTKLKKDHMILPRGMSIWSHERVFILDLPKGKIIKSRWKDANRFFRKASRNYWTKKMIEPFFNSLVGLANKGLSHGRINHNNIFLNEDNSITIGECVTLPNAVLQSFVYKPIHRNHVTEFGDGTGSVSDDLYSFGIFLMWLLSDQHLSWNLSQSSLLAKKLEKGSFEAMSGNELPEIITPLVEILVSDDPNKRCDVKDLKNWCDGNYREKTSATLYPQFKTQFPFRGKKHESSITLIPAFYQNPNQVRKVINEKSLFVWTCSNVDAKREKFLIEACKTIATLDKEALICIICHAIDPNLPFQYRGLVFYEDSLPIMAACYFSKTDGIKLKIIWDFVKRVMPNLNTGDHSKNFKSLEHFMYKSLPMMECQSPLLEMEKASNLKEVIIQLDKLANEGALEEAIQDMHLKTYINAHMNDQFQIKLPINELNSQSFISSSIAMERIVKDKKLSGLVNAFQREIERVVSDKISVKTIRENYLQQIQEVCSQVTFSRIKKLEPLKSVIKRSEKREKEITEFIKHLTNTISDKEENIGKKGDMEKILTILTSFTLTLTPAVISIYYLILENESSFLNYIMLVVACVVIGLISQITSGFFFSKLAKKYRKIRIQKLIEQKEKMKEEVDYTEEDY